jgi:flagellar hook-associated protein 1
MSGLFGSLSIALSGLSVSQQELETTSNNVANANTPGYSREIAVTTPGTPVIYGPLSIGTGVVLEKIQSLRDPILEIQLNQETQQQSNLNAQLEQLQQLQTQFSSSTSGIGADISNFFNTLQQLSPDPTNLALRQSVLTAAGKLATDFNNTSQSLQTQGSNLNLSVVADVGQVNTLASQIASLDQQISRLPNPDGATTLLDQRTSLIRQLSELVDVAVVQTGHGGIDLTSGGTTLVAGAQSFALTTQIGVGGNQQVMAGTQNITSTLKGGSLAGTIDIRDQEIPSVSGQLDQLAAGLSTALNTANHRGFDLNGNQGVNLFTDPPLGGTGAAAVMQVAITDPSLLAASSDGTKGSNGNLAVLAAVHDQAVAGGQTPLDFYSSIVFNVGDATANTSADVDASNQILQQLQDQRGSISGVSLDEEAANIIQYQTAYQAAARVVSTVNSLLADAVNLGLGAAVQ